MPSDEPTPRTGTGEPGEARPGRHHSTSEIAHDLAHGVSERAKKSWRKWKWLVRIVVGVPVIIAAVVLLLMRSPLVGWVAARQIADLTGCRLESGRAFINLDGTLIMESPVISAPGVPGDAGKVLRAESARFDLDWSGVLLGNVGCTWVHLNKPVVLLSFSDSDGAMNLASLAKSMPAGASASPLGLPPLIDMVDGAIEFADHDARGATTLLKRIDVDGAFLPTRADKPVYSMRLYEKAHSDFGPIRGMVVDGTANLEAGTLKMRLSYLPLTAWGPESIPSVYRDVWRRLNIQGEVKQATLTYSPADGLVLDTEVADVRMNALVPAEESFKGPRKDLVLSNVNGTIQMSKAGVLAKLTAALEGQRGRSTIVLRSEGLDLDGAMSCTITGERVELSKNPQFLPYVPPTVREYFQYFSGPTAVVDAVAIVQRAAPVNGQAADFQVVGRLSFQRGAAAFHKFPYPFHDLEGAVEFDDKTIKVVNIKGKGPTGAVLTATGTISPLTDDAGVDVNVKVLGAPLDEHLIGAMPANRQKVVRTIFSRGAYERLLNAGLVRRPNQMGIDGTRAAPPFEFGGVASIDVRVRRKEGPEGEWLTDVDVKFPYAGIVCEPFPLPVEARNLQLHISDDDAKLISGEFSGINGGKAEVRAGVAFFENGKRVVKPDIRIGAFGIPIDALLVNALPGDDAAGTGKDAPAPLTARRFVREMGVSGTLEAGLTITADPNTTTPEDPDVDYDVAVQMNPMKASPLFMGAPSGLTLENLTGIVRVTRRELLVSDAHGVLVRTPGAGGGAALVIGEADLDVSLNLGDKQGGYRASIGMKDLRLDEPFERVMGMVSEDVPRLIADLREQRQPNGRVDARVDVSRAGGTGVAGPDVRVRVDRTNDLEVRALGGRLGVALGGGSVSFELPSGSEARVEAEEASVGLRWNGAEAGAVSLNGFVTLERETVAPTTPAHLEATLSGWAFESPLLEPLVERLGDQSAAQRFKELSPSGAFDAEIAMADAAPKGGGGGGDRRLLLSGFVRPRSLAFVRRGTRLEFGEVSGRVSFESDPSLPDATRGTIDGMVLASEHWRGWIDGEWSVAGQPGARHLAIDASLGVDAEKVDDRLGLLVPDSVWSGLKDMETKIDGGLELVGGRVVGTLGGAESGSGADAGESVGFSGHLTVHDASANVGVEIKAPVVAVDVDWSGNPARPDGRDSVDVLMPKASAVGMGLENARVRIERGAGDGVFELPMIEASCHGGKVSGQARITSVKAPTPEIGAGADGARTGYDLDLLMAGIRFAPLLGELTRAGAAQDFVGPMPDDRIDPDMSRGQLDAHLTIAGISGDVGSRVGSGAIRIAHGQVIRLPIVFPLLQVSNFMLPSRDRFDQVEASYRIAGAEARFDNIEVRSRTISMVGDGTLTMPEMGLDMHFNSRSNARVPLLSGLYEAVRDELVTTKIVGTLKEPVVSTETLFGTRKAIRAIVHGPEKPRAAGPDEAAASRPRTAAD